MTILVVCSRVSSVPTPVPVAAAPVLVVRLGMVVFRPMLFNVVVAVVGSAQVVGTVGPPAKLLHELSNESALVLTVPCVVVVLAVPSICPFALAVLASALVAGVAIGVMKLKLSLLVPIRMIPLRLALEEQLLRSVGAMSLVDGAEELLPRLTGPFPLLMNRALTIVRWVAPVIFEARRRNLIVRSTIRLFRRRACCF